MKEKLVLILTLAVLALAVCGCGTGPEIKTHWQDAVLKPNQSWQDAYGTDNESVLAHGLAQTTRAVNAQARAIGILKKGQEALQAEIDLMKNNHGVVDPKGVKE